MPGLSRRTPRAHGFTLIELLLVLAVIGILSAIAIPSYMGQRRRARVIGDAISNAKVLQMDLESNRAENGIYGAAGTYDWTADGSATTGPALVPMFAPQGNSKMNYSVTIDATGITYTLTVYDPSMSATTVAYQTNQSGAELQRLH
jgi:prepilin-type N-terminal cleavage/methylation domain-containing protein